MLYLAYQAQSDFITPAKAWATLALAAGHQPMLAEHPAVRNLTAAYELIARVGLTHTRPPFGIHSVNVGNRDVEVREEAAHRTPFGTLLHFKKDIAADAAAGAAGGAAVGSFRDVVARDGAHHAARARRLHDRLA